MENGSEIYITQVTYHTREEIERRCCQVRVEHQTDKAVLIMLGTAKRWLPKAALKRSRKYSDIYFLRDWFRLPGKWRRPFGWPN